MLEVESFCLFRPCFKALVHPSVNVASAGGGGVSAVISRRSTPRSFLQKLILTLWHVDALGSGAAILGRCKGSAGWGRRSSVRARFNQGHVWV